MELVRQSQAGSLTSFEQLVTRYEGRIHGYVYQRCGNEHDANDVTQAAFVAAYRHLERFDPQHSFASWLFTIARRKLIDHWRSLRPGEPVDEASLVDCDDPSQTLAQREEEQSIWKLARNGLTDEQFDALWLRYREDLSVREVARALRRTETGTKVILFRARRKLAGLLQQQAACPDEVSVEARRPAPPDEGRLATTTF